MVFSVGDRVVLVDFGHRASYLYDGMTGTVVQGSHPERVSIGVSLDRYDERLHNCKGLCEDGHGQWIVPSRLKIIDTTPEGEDWI